MFHSLAKIGVASRLLRSTALSACVGLTLGIAGAQHGASASQMLPTPDCGFGVANNCLMFDDFVVYSMGLLSVQNGDGAPNGNELYAIKSTPGDIQNDIVIGTGASGMGVTTNQGASEVLPTDTSDDAYATPNGMGSPSMFLMGPTDVTGAPTGDNIRGPGATINNVATYNAEVDDDDEISAGQLKLWDIEIGALNTHLGAEQLAFWFNFSESDSEAGLAGQDALGYAQIHLTDFGGDNTPGGVDDTVKTYTFSGNGGTLAPPSLQTAQAQTANVDDILPTANDQWAYIHGTICDTGAGVLLRSCTENAVAGTDINQNLGANLAAFALFSADLDDDVKNGASATSAGDHLDWDLLTVDARLSHIGNGFEQFFIRKVRIDEMAEEVGEIGGTKFNDLNGNGVFDEGEPALEGWTIILCEGFSDCTNTPFMMTTTGMDGSYLFDNLEPGNYSLYEVMQMDWMQTGTSDGPGTTFIQVASLEAGQMRLGQDFFNMFEMDMPNVPEAGTLPVLAFGLAGLALLRRRAQR